jgi:DNA-binding MarR family transcriptional regulator
MKSSPTASAAASRAKKPAAVRPKARSAAAKPKAATLALEANLSYRLSILNFLMGKATQRIYTAEGLSSHEWKVLSVLHRFAPMPAFEIAKWVTLDKAAISRAVRQLRDKGLADRKLHGADARTVDIVLTVKGARLYERMTHETAELQKRLMVGTGAEQQAQFFALVEKVEIRLREELGLPPRARAAK